MYSSYGPCKALYTFFAKQKNKTSNIINQKVNQNQTWLCITLPYQSNGPGGEGGNHTALSSDRGTEGSSCPHKMDSAVQPSGAKRKGVHGIRKEEK